MKYQSQPGFCGPAAIRNALRCFGRKVSERVIAAMAKTTKAGTDSPEMVRTINELGFMATEWSTAKRADAYVWLNHALALGPVILCVDRWQHWLVCIGKCADRFILVDSTNTNGNKEENGVHVVSRSEVIRRWYNRDKNIAMAIAVSKK